MRKSSLFKQSHSGPHKIGFYIRVSTEEQAENPEGSIRNQEERLRATVKLKNMEGPFGDVVEVFIDRARSGKDTNRPELQRMLAMIRRREITLIMVSELSRLSRSIKDFSEIWELMGASDCGFQSLRENFDTTTAAGEMVLYTVANIAQFERRQVSERVSANFQARAERGLYNGGVLPLGYKLIAEKPGYLDIDEESAVAVRKAFEAFVKEGSLSATARWLNENGYRVKREIQGGNKRPRLGYFTIANLHSLLTNRSYLGIRRFKTNSGWREVRANWPALVDESRFDLVNKQLKANHCRRKPESAQRFPFQLTGLCECGTCKERMIGKSAHGNGGKIPYYEHGWSTKTQGCFVKQAFSCKPFRLQAKKLEPAVWEIVSKLLKDERFAHKLIDQAHDAHREKTKSSQAKRIQEKVKSIEGQIDVLAERLSQLPKSVSAAPVFKQMEKLEALKLEEQARLTEVKRAEGVNEFPATLKSYQAYLRAISNLADSPKGESVRGKIIKTLIHKIQITEDGFNAYFYIGRDHVESVLAKSQGTSRINSMFPGSNSLTNGGPCRT